MNRIRNDVKTGHMMRSVQALDLRFLIKVVISKMVRLLHIILHTKLIRKKCKHRYTNAVARDVQHTADGLNGLITFRTMHDLVYGRRRP